MIHFLLSVVLMGGFSLAAEKNIDRVPLQALLNNASEPLQGPVFIYFWASWCPDCREKLAGAVPELQKEFPKVKVITVNADRDAAKGKTYAESEKVVLPVYRDEEKILMKNLKLFGVPAWALAEVSADGSWKVLNAETGSDLAKIKNQLKGQNR